MTENDEFVKKFPGLINYKGFIYQNNGEWYEHYAFTPRQVELHCLDKQRLKAEINRIIVEQGHETFAGLSLLEFYRELGL